MEAIDLFSRRKKAGVRQGELAVALRLHANALKQIEHGMVGIDMETYQRIVRTIDEIAARKSQGAEERLEVTA